MSAFWAIGFWFVQQVVLGYRAQGHGGVAYGAHLGGFALSAVVSLLLVWGRAIEPQWGQSQVPRATLTQEQYRARQEAMKQQRLRTPGVVVVALASVVVIGAGYRVFKLYQNWAANQLTYYEVVVPSDAAAGLEGDLHDLTGIVVAAKPHVSHAHQKLTSYWLGVQTDSGMADDKQTFLRSRGYPATIDNIDNGLSIVYWEKTFGSEKAARKAARTIEKKTRGLVDLQPMQAFRIVTVQDTQLELSTTDPSVVKSLTDLVAKRNLTLVTLTSPPQPGDGK
jgi:hypothetical protein